MIPRIAIALLFASLSVNAVLLWPQLDWRILPAILLGWLIVDLVSGLFHMLFDYYPCPARLELDRIYFHDRRNTREYEQLRAQLMKRAGMFYSVVYDFKVHHPRPNTLGRRDFFKLTEFTAPFWALPVSLCVNVVAFAFPVPGWLMAFIIGNAMAQYFHATLHRKNTPLPISLLRRVGLLSRRQRIRSITTRWTGISPLLPAGAIRC
jgi:hypothetical protein